MKKETNEYRFELNIDGKKIGPGNFDLCKNGEAGFWTKNETFHLMRCKIEWVGKEGIFLSGFKYISEKKYKYVEWYLKYL